MDKNSVKDLTSQTLAKQRGEYTVKTDKEEEEILQKWMKTQQVKYKDGNIPAKKLKEFKTQRKVLKFHEDLKNQLFRVIFRDPKFMQQLDKTILEKAKFRKEQTQFLPTIVKKDEVELILKNKDLQRLHDKLATSPPPKSSKNAPANKFGKAVNTQRLDFDPSDFFYKNKVSVFENRPVKGGGGAMVIMQNKAKEIEYLGTQQKITQRDEPTLDRKGRINEKMYQFYPGLYNKINMRKQDKKALEKDREIDEKKAQAMQLFNEKRQPQFMSKSMSPYLLANSFSFDVTEIMKEVKEFREKQLTIEKYSQMSRKDLNMLLLKKQAKDEKD